MEVMSWRIPLFAIFLWEIIASIATADTNYVALSGCSQGFAMPGTSLVSQQTRSLLECAKSCALNSACLAFNLCGAASAASSPPFVCHQMASWARNCSRLSPDSSCSFRQKDIQCVYGNINPLNGQCECLTGAYGGNCEMLFRDCRDGTDMGLTGDDIASLLHPSGAPAPFETRCHFNHGTTTLIWRRDECSANDMFITGSWEELRTPQGTCDKCCSVGLDNIYFLMNQGIQVFFTVYVQYNNWNSWAKIWYPDARITNDLGRYELTFGPPSNQAGSPGDDFLPGGNRKFCTADNDCSGCAAAAGHAGWFDDSGATCKEAVGFDPSLQWTVNGTMKALQQLIFEVERMEI